jgi:hypothetical protein
MLHLTLPLKESVKPRRIQIDTGTDQKERLIGDDRKQLEEAMA